MTLLFQFIYTNLKIVLTRSFHLSHIISDGIWAVFSQAIISESQVILLRGPAGRRDLLMVPIETSGVEVSKAPHCSSVLGFLVHREKNSRSLTHSLLLGG